ncbi:MAG: chorismate mutase [Sphingomonadaceae bacterium]|nr:chorismate mutase [Sphingomonadaceae bacterium]
MHSSLKNPEDCCSMAEVRAGVDQTDKDLFALLTRRFAFMRAAARIKEDRSAVRDEERKAEVIRAIVDAAQEAGLPANAIGAIWNDLVETSIAYEMDEWDRLRR